ncbi:hypothetical protein [Pseudomonas paeninsulae]|uniref:hypothetical protein n=1 Tax=Pseudomonas paeninsulae TaxID=3110772 RepID=UPI002D78E26C|nr:hypothetical protein [Pseudomonas sp. IT1137]
MIRLQGDAPQVGDLIVQVGFPLPDKAVRLVDDAFGDTPLLGGQPPLSEQQADQAQAQERCCQRRMGWIREESLLSSRSAGSLRQGSLNAARGLPPIVRH